MAASPLQCPAPTGPDPPDDYALAMELETLLRLPVGDPANAELPAGAWDFSELADLRLLLTESDEPPAPAALPLATRPLPVGLAVAPAEVGPAEVPMAPADGGRQAASSSPSAARRRPPPCPHCALPPARAALAAGRRLLGEVEAQLVEVDRRVAHNHALRLQARRFLRRHRLVHHSRAALRSSVPIRWEGRFCTRIPAAPAALGRLFGCPLPFPAPDPDGAELSRLPPDPRPWTPPEHDQLRRAVLTEGIKLIRYERLVQPPAEACFELVTEEEVDVAVDRFGPLQWAAVGRVLPHRCVEECAMCWNNHLSPSVNHSDWTAAELRRLRSLALRHEERDWAAVANQLGTRRTPLACLQQYTQERRILQPLTLTPAEQEQFGDLVAALAPHWDAIARRLTTDDRPVQRQQCIDYWRVARHNRHLRQEPWTEDESSLLRLAMWAHESGDWVSVSRHLDRRSAVQCKDHWRRTLAPLVDPDRNQVGPWTAQEDARLRQYVRQCGFRWAQVAQLLPGRSADLCRARWRAICTRLEASQYAAWLETKRTQPLALQNRTLARHSNATLAASTPLVEPVVPIAAVMGPIPAGRSVRWRAGPLTMPSALLDGAFHRVPRLMTATTSVMVSLLAGHTEGHIRYPSPPMPSPCSTHGPTAGSPNPAFCSSAKDGWLWRGLVALADFHVGSRLDAELVLEAMRRCPAIPKARTTFRSPAVQVKRKQCLNVPALSCSPATHLALFKVWFLLHGGSPADSPWRSEALPGATESLMAERPSAHGSAGSPASPPQLPNPDVVHQLREAARALKAAHRASVHPRTAPTSVPGPAGNAATRELDSFTQSFSPPASVLGFFYRSQAATVNLPRPRPPPGFPLLQTAVNALFGWTALQLSREACTAAPALLSQGSRTVLVLSSLAGSPEVVDRHVDGQVDAYTLPDSVGIRAGAGEPEHCRLRRRSRPAPPRRREEAQALRVAHSEALWRLEARQLQELEATCGDPDAPSPPSAEVLLAMLQRYTRERHQLHGECHRAWAAVRGDDDGPGSRDQAGQGGGDAFPAAKRARRAPA